jgi:hypothetical protein
MGRGGEHLDVPPTDGGPSARRTVGGAHPPVEVPGAGEAQQVAQPLLGGLRDRRQQGQVGARWRATGGLPAQHRRPHPSPGRLRGAEREPVLVQRPNQRLRPGAVVVEDEVAEAAHDRHGDPRELPFDQVCRGGDLVGDREHGDAQGVAPRVDPAPQVLHRSDARRAHRHVGLPGPPRPPEGVGHDHAHLHTEPVAQPRPDATGRRVGVRREQQQGARSRVGPVHPRGGHDEAVSGRDDPRVAPRGDESGGLRVDDGLTRGGTGRGDELPFRLADDLAGDHDDVAVAQLGG